MSRRHIVIPDTQVKPGVRVDHLERAGMHIARRRPDVVVHLGDHWDMPSLSSYDRGTKGYEGRRYIKDIEAGNKGLALLTAPIHEEIKNSRRSKLGPWNPRMVLLRGNHEQRIERAVNADPMLEGALSYSDFNDVELGWEIHDFLDIVDIHGIWYSHYFYNPMSGKPYGGQSMDTRLKTVGHSFTMGHQQIKLAGERNVGKATHRGLVVGAFYQHDEGYKGPQGNTHWRGLIEKNEVKNGNYDIVEVSMGYLARTYNPGKRINA